MLGIIAGLILIAYSVQSAEHTLHLASACFSKDTWMRTVNFSHFVDVPLRTHGKACGEDDFFLSRNGDIQLMTVADGVGSWNNHGINPKVFTHELMRSMFYGFKKLDKEFLSQHDKRSRTFLLTVIRNAYNEVQKKRFIRLGSSTLVSLSLNLKTLHLNTYNLGDSGFMIIRKGRILYRSKEQQHQFNMPYQLAFVPEHGSEIEDGFLRPIKLKVNDIIVIGSDGLFDNIFDEGILYYVNAETSHLNPLHQQGYSEAAREIAKYLTMLAKWIGEREGLMATPFSEELNKQGVADFTIYAGKNDDTTVVVAIIS